MTVLYFADTRFPIERANGAQTMATCHALAARGHDVTLVVRPDSAAPARDPFQFYGLPAHPRLTIRRIAAAGGPGARRVRFLLQAAAMAARARGVVYTRDLGLAAFLLQMPAPRRPRVVYESHGIADVVAAEMPALLGREDLAASPSKLHRLARREARVWRRATAYVTITRALADDLAARFGDRAGVVVAPDGVADDLVERPPTEPSSPSLVGYAGHFYPWKGVDVLIRAIAIAPAVSGLIVGGHPQEPDRARVEGLARDLGAADRIRFAGQVAPAEAPRLLSTAAILALPNTASSISSRYTSPLKLFEYLAIGRAIVASDLPAVREILTDGDNACLVPAGDPLALAQAIGALAASPARARALADAARRLAPRYTWGARAERLDAALGAGA